MSFDKQIFFSPGKLLISSEYFVLDGALALAVPTKLGQEMTVETIEDGNSIIEWRAFHESKYWFSILFNSLDFSVISTDNVAAANFILKVFEKLKILNLQFFKNKNSFVVETNLQFPANYGLGSSSTLMNNLANWVGVCPFTLNSLSLGGSGYDIAVAQENSAILYKNLPEISFEKICYNPTFANQLILIHLNTKQDSREGIQLYKSKILDRQKILEFSNLTQSIIQADTIEAFSEYMELHERTISEYLEIKTVKESYFSDCPVFVKSLGAWGGDFVLSMKFEGYKTYFLEKGFSDIWQWKDLVV